MSFGRGVGLVQDDSTRASARAMSTDVGRFGRYFARPSYLTYAFIGVIIAWAIAILRSLALQGLRPYHSHGRYILIAVAVGSFLLLLPALKLYRSRARSDAMALFNKASYFPLALLVIVLIKTTM